MKIHKALVALFLIPGLIAACDSEPACEARPTTMAQQPDGAMACFEADGELCDDDPCDAEPDSHKTKPKKKPAGKK